MRKIKPTRRSVSGHYAFKGNKSIVFESTLERDFLIRNEFFANVIDIIPQPVVISFVKNGRTYPYTPDFLVYYSQENQSKVLKPTLVEVKPRSELRQHWNDWRSKFRHAYRFAKSQGWEFKIYDESRIRDQVLENIRFLERYKRMQFSPETSQPVKQAIRDLGNTSLKEFLNSYKSDVTSLIWHLAATKQLDCNIKEPLNQNTHLWMPVNE